MNIALITDDYIPHTDDNVRFLINFRNGLEQLGEKIYVFNSTYHDPKNLCYKIISSKKTLKSIFNQKLSFFLFQLFIFYKILRFQGISFINKLKLSFYYCIYPKNLVNRIITINNLFNAFNKFNIDIVFCGKSAQPLFYSYILSHLFKKPLLTLAHKDDFIMKYPFNLNSILFKKSDRIIVTNKIMERFFIRVHHVAPNKVSIINLGVDMNSIFLEYQKVIKKTYFDYYYFCEGNVFHVKLYNPFQIKKFPS